MLRWLEIIVLIRKIALLNSDGDLCKENSFLQNYIFVF